MRAVDHMAPFLRECALFRGVPDDELALIASELGVVTFAAGDEIIREGDAPNAAYLVADGEAAVVGTDLIGNEVTLRVFAARDTFGEVGLLTRAPRTATVKARTDVRAHVLTRDAFERLRASVPRFLDVLRRYADVLEMDRHLQTASPFAGLPKETIRAVAARMRRVTVEPGTAVVSEGDDADRFFFVRSGALEVLRDGQRLHMLGPGDVFGEVALLTGGRRIATVRAAGYVELFALERADFDEAVGEGALARGRVNELARIRYRATTGQPLLLPDPISTLMPYLPARSRRRYWLLLLAGAAVFTAASAAALATGATAPLFVTLVAGAFVVPVVYVIYLAEIGIVGQRPRTVIATFLLGALIGLPLAVIVEGLTGVRAGSPQGALAVSLIEETAKILALVWLVGRATARFQMDGIVFGAAAGMGFAAFETLLFGLTSIERVQSFVTLLLLRSFLAPLGHGTWTAIVAGTIWRRKTARGVRVDGPVIAAFAAAVGLHALWDLQPLPGLWNFAWSAAVGLVGLLILRVVVQRATAEEMTAVISLNPELASAAPDAERLSCRFCEQLSPPGAHYCVRCGAALVRIHSLSRAAVPSPPGHA